MNPFYLGVLAAAIRKGGVTFTFTPDELFAPGYAVPNTPVDEMATYGGSWWDPSDFSTLFQDAAGTIPVVSVGDRVGLMLDKGTAGNHVSQTDNALRPTLKVDSGGRYYLELDGAGPQSLTRTTVTGLCSGSVAGFCAAAGLGESANAWIYSRGPATTRQSWFVWYDDTNVVEVGMWGDSVNVTGNALGLPFVGANWKPASTAGHSRDVNQVAPSVDTSTTALQLGPIRIGLAPSGGGGPGDGRFYGAIELLGDIPEITRHRISWYLGKKCGADLTGAVGDPDRRGIWYDPMDASTLFTDVAMTTVANVGDSVAAIKDKSGSNNHLFQATLAQQPTLQVDSNGKRYLQFSANQWLQRLGSDNMNRPKFVATGSDPSFIMAAAMQQALNTEGNRGTYVFSRGDDGTALQRVVTAGADRVASTYYSGGVMNSYSGPGLDEIAVIGLETNADGSNKLWGNGALGAVNNDAVNTTENSASGIALGRSFNFGSSLFNGRFYGMIEAMRRLTETERINANLWFLRKIGEIKTSTLSPFYEDLPLTNPGAETGTTAGWTGNSAGFVTSNAYPGFDGTRYFIVGNVASSEFYQDKAVPPARYGAVDTGNCRAILTLKQSSFNTEDPGRPVLVFLNGSGVEIGRRRGPLRMAPQGFVRRIFEGIIPAGTRTIRVMAQGFRTGGTECSAYFDSFNLAIAAQQHVNVSQVIGNAIVKTPPSTRVTQVIGFAIVKL